MNKSIPKQVNWQDVLLGDVADIQNGFAFKSADFVDSGGTPVIKIKNVASGKLNMKGCVFYSKNSTKLENYKIQNGDILIAMTGSHVHQPSSMVGRSVRYKGQTALLNQRVGKVYSIDSKILSENFLFYYLKQENVVIELASKAGGSANQANISPTLIKSLSLKLPSINEQKAIAEVLSSLEDKIDLLYHQNQTLEDLTQVLFRKWFMDGSDKLTEEKALGDYVECINGASYKSSELNHSATALVTLKNFERDGGFKMDGFKEYTGRYKERQTVKQGDLVVAHTDITQDAAVIGNPVLVVSNPLYEKLVISMDLVKVEPKDDRVISKEFLYSLMKTREFKYHCLGNSNGSTVLHLSKSAIPTYCFSLPSDKKMKDFTNDAKIFFNKKNSNISQIRTLEQLRDILLLRLVNGTVKVKT